MSFDRPSQSGQAPDSHDGGGFPREVMRRAWKLGANLVFTVDMPVPGAGYRDAHSGAQPGFATCWCEYDSSAVALAFSPRQGLGTLRAWMVVQGGRAISVLVDGRPGGVVDDFELEMGIFKGDIGVRVV